MDHDEHMDPIDAQFNHAVDIVQSLSKTGPIQTAYEDKLEMYSLFKQATVGDVDSPRPPMWDVLGRAKWDAWEKQKGLEHDRAKWLYVQTLQKVLRRYSDRTVARDLSRELDAYNVDPSHMVMSVGSPDHLTDYDSASDDASSTRGRARPNTITGVPTGFMLPPSTSPIPLTASPAALTADEGLDLPSEHGEHHEPETDEEERHDVVQPVFATPVSSMTNRPSSAMSSQMRYRTPTAPHHSNTMLVPTPVPNSAAPHQTSFAMQQQPIHRYTTPSAFAQPPPSAPPIGPLSFGNTTPQPFQQQPVATGSTAYYPSGHMPSTGGHPHRTPLERAVEAMQTSLAALHERMESIEAGLAGRTPPTSVRNSAHIPALSPRGAGSYFSTVYGMAFDAHQTGAWSIILVPLTSVISRIKQLIHFLAYPLDPSNSSARLIVIRRLLLDASFLFAIWAIIRAIWRVTGLRRREVLRALVGVWHAITGRTPAAARELVDKAVGHH